MSLGIFLLAVEMICTVQGSWGIEGEGFLLLVIRIKITFITEDINMLDAFVMHAYNA